MTLDECSSRSAERDDQVGRAMHKECAEILGEFALHIFIVSTSRSD
jgi:hypothetical protein